MFSICCRGGVGSAAVVIVAVLCAVGGMPALCSIWERGPFTNGHRSGRCSWLSQCLHLLALPVNKVLYSDVSMCAQFRSFRAAA